MKFSPQKVDFEIEYENGEKGIITFNPYDKKFYDNLEKLPDKIFKSIEKIDFRENANEFVSTGDKILSDISNGNITSVKELSSKEKKKY